MMQAIAQPWYISVATWGQIITYVLAPIALIAHIVFTATFVRKASAISELLKNVKAAEEADSGEVELEDRTLAIS